MTNQNLIERAVPQLRALRRAKIDKISTLVYIVRLSSLALKRI